MMFKTKERKTKSIGKLKKECLLLLSKYVRLRDCLRTTGTLTHCKCISCMRLIDYKTAQAGHLVDRRHSATLFNLVNVNAQCPRCNIFLDGNILQYRRALIALYGEEAVNELEDMATEIKHFTVDELLNLKEEFTQKIKELESNY
ncbi:MAG: recombination protein NinG [Dehalococcoidia bacterium]